MTAITYRPIDSWPGKLTLDAARRRSPFTRPKGDGSWSRESVSLGETLNLLDRELDYLDARQAVVQIALPESGFRLDGQPRADARTPDHPGVIVAFDSRHGPLKYATDTFTSWQANLRAVALALEALRKVDRYGITTRGEQYTGWKQIGATPHGAVTMTREEAAAFLAAALPGADPAVVARERIARDACYRAAVKQLHPDHGGDTASFQRLQDAMRVLNGAA